MHKFSNHAENGYPKVDTTYVKKCGRKEKKMSREQAKQNLIGLGIAEPTEENITDYLNQVNGESKKEKDRAEKLKGEAEKVAELQKQLDDLTNANLSEIELAKKETEKANGQVLELTKQLAQIQTAQKLAEIGIIGEDAKKLFSEDGSLDISALGEIIKARETASATAKEQEIANGSTNPNGGKGGADDSTKSEAEKFASKLVGNKDNNNSDIIKNYL